MRGSDPPSGGPVVVSPPASPGVLGTIPGLSSLELLAQALLAAVVLVQYPPNEAPWRFGIGLVSN